MRQSQLFTKTLREAPKDEKSVNAQLLTRAGFVHKEMAGVYTFLPLGKRVLKNIENIIREEMNKVGGQEILMPVLQPKHLWEKTDRWSKGVGKVMYKTLDVSGKELALGPTHEEILTNIISKYVKSYADLPLYIYQIQTKFRKEPRARSGLLRGREFGMKDLYSFHSSKEDFKKYYEVIKKSYLKIFKRCGFEAIIAEASGAGFTKECTHEFQVLAEGGEDSIIYCLKHHFAQNREIAQFKKGDLCPICKGHLKRGKSIEVGNIFPLGAKYSKDLNAYFIDKDGKRKLVIMGCYGIGSTRIMGSVVEVHHDNKGIVWPEEIAPFKFHLIPIENTREVMKTAESTYRNLSSFAEATPVLRSSAATEDGEDKSQKKSYGAGGFIHRSSNSVGGQKQKIEVLYDDRKGKGVGERLNDSDLIGIPYRLVLSEKTLKKKSIEVKKRNEKKIRLIRLNQLITFLRSLN